MTIERSIIFANGQAYNLMETEAHVIQTFEENSESGLFPAHRYECIMSYLIELRYISHIDLEDMIIGIDGVYRTLDIWMRDYGIADTTFVYSVMNEQDDVPTLGDDESIDTFTVGDTEWTNTFEEEITSDDEEMLIDAAVAITELKNR